MSGDKTDNQVDVLDPDLTQVIAGRDITMREPSWLESLEWEPKIMPLVNSLQQQLKDEDAAGADPARAIMQLLASEHRSALIAFMAFCARVDVEWIHKLNDADGQHFMLLFWRVNFHFFARRLSLARSLGRSSVELAGARSLHS